MALAWLTTPVQGQSAWADLQRFLGHDIVPRPLRDSGGGWDALGGWFWSILIRQVLPGTLDTLVVALVGMAALALVLFPHVTRRAGRLGRPAGRALLVVVRSTPEYMLAYVLLQILGPSMLPAILALALHNGGIVGHLMGGHADALPYRPDAPRGLDLHFYETVPRLYGQFLAYVLYR